MVVMVVPRRTHQACLSWNTRWSKDKHWETEDKGTCWGKMLMETFKARHPPRKDLGVERSRRWHRQWCRIPKDTVTPCCFGDHTWSSADILIRFYRRPVYYLNAPLRSLNERERKHGGNQQSFGASIMAWQWGGEVTGAAGW